MKAKEVLSVIVPVYNAEAYLYKCVKSILNQTYKNLDIILIDDGSSDHSGEICDGLAEKDRRIRVFHTKNHGVVAARNYGVNKAQGNLITFVDSDDWIEPDMYLYMLEVYEKYEPDMITSGLIYDAAVNSKTLECDLIAEGIYDKGQIEREIIPVMMFDQRKRRRAVTSAVCNKIIRKDLWNKASQGINSQITYGEDAAVVYLCLAQAQKAFFINGAWYHYRVNNNSMVHSFNITAFEKIKNFMDYMKVAYERLGIWNQMEVQLSEYVKHFLYPAIESVYGIKLGETKYLFPYELIKANSRIVIYGAGRVGRAYMKNLIKTNYAKVAAWVDKAYEKILDLKDQVQLPNILSKLDFDYLVIAVESEQIAMEIEQDLINMGVSRDKLIWKSPEIL